MKEATRASSLPSSARKSSTVNAGLLLTLFGSVGLVQRRRACPRRLPAGVSSLRSMRRLAGAPLGFVILGCHGAVAQSYGQVDKGSKDAAPNLRHLVASTYAGSLYDNSDPEEANARWWR